jgi:hypothetical protein
MKSTPGPEELNVCALDVDDDIEDLDLVKVNLERVILM